MGASANERPSVLPSDQRTHPFGLPDIPGLCALQVHGIRGGSQSFGLSYNCLMVYSYALAAARMQQLLQQQQVLVTGFGLKRPTSQSVPVGCSVFDRASRASNGQQRPVYRCLMSPLPSPHPSRVSPTPTPVVLIQQLLTMQLAPFGCLTLQRKSSRRYQLHLSSDHQA